MKQIKTIHWRADNFAEFDNTVNAALRDGWILIRRTVLPPYDCGSTYFHRMLLAELEREIITEAEKTCDNCKWHDVHPDAEPCASCQDGEKWEVEE